jgi:opacity protein-like surface antigen
VAALATPAHAQLAFGLGGGATFPVGSLDNAYNTGYNALATLAVRVPAFPLGFRLDGMFDQLPVKASTGFTGNTQIYSLTGNAVLMLPGAHIVSPYLIGGVGYYNDHYKIDVSGSSVGAGGSTSDNNFGVNGGAGLKFGVSTFSVFGEIRYHYVFNGDAHYQIVPLTVGVMY